MANEIIGGCGIISLIAFVWLIPLYLITALFQGGWKMTMGEWLDLNIRPMVSRNLDLTTRDN